MDFARAYISVGHARGNIRYSTNFSVIFIGIFSEYLPSKRFHLDVALIMAKAYACIQHKISNVSSYCFNVKLVATHTPSLGCIITL